MVPNITVETLGIETRGQRTKIGKTEEEREDNGYKWMHGTKEFIGMPLEDQ